MLYFGRCPGLKKMGMDRYSVLIYLIGLIFVMVGELIPVFVQPKM